MHLEIKKERITASRRDLMALVLVAGAVASASPASAAVVLVQDGFDSENGGTAALNYSGFANWNVTDGTVDLIGNGSSDVLPGNGLYVDLDGSAVDAGTIESKTAFALDPGLYELKFDLAGSQRGDTNTVTVRLGVVYVESFTLASSEPFTTITRTVAVASPTTATLSFEHEGFDFVGLLLDDVRLSLTTTAVPGIDQWGMVAIYFGIGIVLVFRSSRTASRTPISRDHRETSHRR